MWRGILLLDHGECDSCHHHGDLPRLSHSSTATGEMLAWWKSDAIGKRQAVLLLDRDAGGLLDLVGARSGLLFRTGVAKREEEQQLPL